MAQHLGHVHLRVRDLERAVAFYTDIFELVVTERIGRFAFLSFGEHHHDVALQSAGEDAPGPGAGVGLYHAAVEVGSAEELRAVHERLLERDVDVSAVDRGISEAIYFEDPSGNGLEAYLDTRDRVEKWEGPNEPFDPVASAGDE